MNLLSPHLIFFGHHSLKRLNKNPKMSMKSSTVMAGAMVCRLETLAAIGVNFQPPRWQHLGTAWMLSSKSSARNCCSYWAPNSFLVKTGHTTVVIKLEGMLGARLVISPTVSLGLRLPRPNQRQVFDRVLGAKVRDWAGDGGHSTFVDHSSFSFFRKCLSCLLKHKVK